jgi:branched-chain amino acid transport system substrate-binding protein
MRSLRLAATLGAAALGVALFLPSCSFISAGNFKECTVDSDCSNDDKSKVCLKGTAGGGVGYCIPMEQYCRRESGDFSSENAIKIAAVLPLTSGTPDAGVADDSESGGLNAIKLAMDEINTRTIEGRKFALYVCDTFRDKVIINKQVTWLSDTLGVKSIFFSGSGQGIEAHKVTSTKDVLLMSATATSPELVNVNQTSGLIWRTAPPDTLQGKVLTDYVKAEGDGGTLSTVSNVSVVYVDDAYGQGLEKVIRAGLPGPAMGGPYTVRSVAYTEGDDLTPVVNALSLQTPQLTVLIAFRAEAKDILTKAAGKPNLKATNGHKWMFTDSAKDPAILDGVTLPEVSGSFGFAPAQGRPGEATYLSFKDRFLQKYQTDSDQYSFLTHAYDQMYVMALAYAYALGPAGGGTVTGSKLAEGLQKLSSGTRYTLDPTNLSGMLGAMKAGTAIDIDGTSGKLDFNPDAGAPGAPIERWQITPAGNIVQISITELPLNL